MVEDSNNRGGKQPGSDKDIKNQQALIEALEKRAAETTTTVVSSRNTTSTPIAEDASVAQQLTYAERKLQKHRKHKAKLALLPNAEIPAQTSNEERTSYEDEKVRLDALMSMLERSDLASSLLHGHSGKKVQLIQDKQIFGVTFVKDKNLIAFNPQMTLGEAVCGVVRELRRAWLASDGDILYPLAYSPEDAILLNRILEADANTISVWVAWELKLQGHSEAWAYALSSNEALMAKSFAAAARQDFRRLSNGYAAKSAFDAWFKSGIDRYHDRAVIQDMLADERGYVFSTEKTPIVITSSLLDFIGEVPGDKNYMNAVGEKPMPGTSFAAVNDRSNANFLWFVKFERSFQETEKELISKEKEDATHNEKIERKHRAQKSAQKSEGVIDLSGHFAQEMKEKNISVYHQEVPHQEKLPENVVVLFNGLRERQE